MQTLNRDQFLKDYLLTAAWVTCDTGECTDFYPAAVGRAKLDINKFITLVIDRFGNDRAMQLLTIPGNDLGYLAAHDFFLTRNGHGAGFWDKENEYGENEATILTELSKEMGSVDCIHENTPDTPLIFV